MSYEEDPFMGISEKGWKRLFVIAIVLTIMMFAGCHIKSQTVDYVESHEIGYSYNMRTGNIRVLNKTGYIFHEYWFVEVNTIDLRPLQVCINANQRVLNCKLVKFNPAGLQQFISWHGRQNYSLGDLEPILMSYAYENAGHTYPFLTVIREMNTTDSGNSVQ